MDQKQPNIIHDKSHFQWLRVSILLLAWVLFWFIGVGDIFGSKPMVNLTLWTHQRHMSDLIEELINEFNTTVGLQKGIKVSLRILGDDSWGLFQEAQRKGIGPDLYSTGFNTGYSDPFKEGAQIWFDDFPDFQAWKQSWPSWYWIEGLTTHRGHVYAIPAQVFNSRLIYNKDLFRAAGLDPERPPRSYPELRKMAKQITTRCPNSFGFAYCGGESWPMEWMPSQWAEANGEPAYWDWNTGRWAIQGYEKVFQLILNLQKDGSLFPGAAILTNDALRAQFAEGRIGMFMGETWDVGVFNSQFPAKCDWGVAAIPTHDGNFHGKSRAMMIAGFWNINGQCRHKFEAWEVVKWFDRYEVRIKMFERGKCIDPDPKVVPRVANEFMASQPIVPGFEAFAGTLNQDYRATYPILPGWERPPVNPCMLFKGILSKGGDLKFELKRLEQIWNLKLDKYYRENPQVKRGWNIYPQFDRRFLELGAPLVKPTFPLKN
jgi:multiple sugar transport system substrate-binding protein